MEMHTHLEGVMELALGIDDAGGSHSCHCDVTDSLP